MSEKSIVLGVEGGALVRDELLAPVIRWTPARKANVVLGFNGGLVSMDDLVKAHNISADEILGWVRHYRKLGIKGLKERYTAERRVAETAG